MQPGEAVDTAGDARTASADRWHLAGQVALLVAALVVGVQLSELWFIGVGVAIGAFTERPFLVSGIVLVVGALLFVCFRGAGAAASAIRFPAAGALLLLSTSAGAGALKLIVTGVGLAPWAEEGAPWDAYPPLALGILLMAFAAAGIRQAFAWRIQYWIMLVATVVGLVLAVLGLAAVVLVFAS